MKASTAISDTRKKEILGVLLIALAIFVGMSLFSYDRVGDNQILKQHVDIRNPVEIFSQKFNNQCGPVGAGVSYLILYAWGYSGFFMPLFLVLLGISCFRKARLAFICKKVLFAFIFVLVLGILFVLPVIGSQYEVDFSQVTTGGWVAFALGQVLLKVLGTAGSYILIVASLVALAATITPFKPSYLVLLFRPMVEKLLTQGSKWREQRKVYRQKAEGERESKARRRPEPVLPEVEPAGTPSREPSLTTRVSAASRERASLTLGRGEERRMEGGYRFPSLGFLDDSPYAGSSVSDDELNETAEILKETLSTFGVDIEGERIEIYPGPVITRYEFKPAAGIKVNQVVNLADDLALAMRARKVRIVAPVPGKAAIGVEIPNKNAQTVYLKEILTSSLFQDADAKLSLALGKTSSGEPFVTDLGKMPHLLIAGATGSGKSVCINAIITSLLYRLAPEEIRFVMIDPKMLELTVYEGIPHLERSVITNPKVAEHVLSEIVTEMEQRYRQLAKCGVRNIEDFNTKQEEEDILPYIIIIVDELADLMMSSSTRVEGLITRLAQMARAVGIHLILATQRPSVDVITGLIKANFSARIAFQVASKIDSRTILDVNGAEKLLGSGDMLFIETGHPEPRRLHGAYISSDETTRIVDFIKGQAYCVEPLEILSAQPEETTVQQDAEKDDDLFQKAVELVIRHKQGSVSLLQRRLAVGYQRAARLIDQLEEEGIVGPYDGSKAREVLVDASYLESLEWKERKSRSQDPRGRGNR
ncbi:MAG: DNA translocase FtsK [candidate division Zixibacteria bacterium]|nr:DNA translocase FtsK [candidate division Zixibacteria bacterium]